MAKFTEGKEDSSIPPKRERSGKSTGSFKSYRSNSAKDKKPTFGRSQKSTPTDNRDQKENSSNRRARISANAKDKKAPENPGKPAPPREYNSKFAKGKPGTNSAQPAREERKTFKKPKDASTPAGRFTKGRPDTDDQTKKPFYREKPVRNSRPAGGKTHDIAPGKPTRTGDRKFSPDSKEKRYPGNKFRRGTSNDQNTASEAPLKKEFKKPFDRPARKGKFQEKKVIETPVQEGASSSSTTIRLNKFIANAGICSRREADTLIQDGLIKVNGKIVTELGHKVLRSDVVKFGNKILSIEKLVYVLLNKPKDFITTMDDPQERKTVMDLIKNACTERVFPVGRLDRNTTGLLLLTNDGELTKKLTHPSYEISKIYQVGLDRPFEAEDLEKVTQGIVLEDGPVQVDDIAMVSDDLRFVGIEIHEGKNRIVRRLFESLGYVVETLDRVMYAGLTKKDLPRSKWRLLTSKEIIKLKQL